MFDDTITNRQLYVGNYTFRLIVKDELTPYSIRGSVTFEVEITNIPKEQSRAVNLAQVGEAPQ